VRRDQVFSDSYEQLKDVSLGSWRQRFTVEFHDEEGVDEGGLTREWFQLVSQGIFDANYALFQQSQKGTYFPSPRAAVALDKEEMTAMFRFVGRIIGKALNEGQLLDCFFARAIYKMMLSQPMDMGDLEDFDAEHARSIKYMLENDATVLCQDFRWSASVFDEEVNVELKPDGASIDVDNDNKFEYCQLAVEYLLYKRVGAQIDAFLQGFRDLVPAHLIRIFDHEELELMLSGLPTVDVADLRDHAIYKQYTNESQVIQWLWEVLEEFQNADRGEFIQFITGTSKVPVEGFAGLRNHQGQLQKVEIVKLPAEKPDSRLPQAHTCFFQLDLPEYSSKDILRKRVTLAIKEGRTFNIA
jgi:E3 ubiquitin-protein ligase HUWE1